MMEQNFAQLQAKIEADNSLVEKLFALESADEVQDFLKTQGIDLSLEEISMLRDGIVKAVEKGEISADGELSDEDLEEVAGGNDVTAIIGAVVKVAGLIVKGGNLVHNVTRGRW